MHIASIGIDLGKTTFHLVALGERNKVLARKKFSRAQLLVYTANQPASLIGLEACAGAHFVGAALQAQGHQVRLIPAQFVKPYRKSNKDDFIDAEAIAEAATKQNMRFVQIKTQEQLDWQAMHRVRDRPARQASAMAREEAERFLTAIREVCAERYVFFLTALRAGLRKGELIALKWGDVQFGDSADDPNRYILVQRNYSHGRFTSPKSKKSRRVDLSKQLRAALIELRDTHLLNAMMAGNPTIADCLVFPSGVGTVIKPDNIVPRYMEPALEQAGLRRFRFHDLRHTFGSLLIQDGASLTYVKEQMGHSSIQITVDTYGHLTPGADIAWVDRLDSKTTQQQNATPAQQAENEAEQETGRVAENIWLPPRDSNPDMLIQSQLSCR